MTLRAHQHNRFTKVKISPARLGKASLHRQTRANGYQTTGSETGLHAVFAGGTCCLCLVAAANPYPKGLDLGDAAFSNQRCVERDVGVDAIAKCLRR
jgi:hypothetical protein